VKESEPAMKPHNTIWRTLVRLETNVAIWTMCEAICPLVVIAIPSKELHKSYEEVIQTPAKTLVV